MKVLNTRNQFAGVAVCLLIGMLLSVIDRTDANWDLQNYHLYAPYAALHGRLGMDWFVAGFQGYLNPTEDIPYYLVKMVLFPRHPLMVAALAGIPFGYLIFVTFNIALVVLPDSFAVAAGAALLGLTGATVLSEVGTTYDDIQMADLVLSAVWLALVHTSWRRLALAGFLMGCAVGLKFTAAIYVPGFVLLCVLKYPKSILRDGVIIGFFAVVGFVAVWGWWGWQLWAHFGNPFFPMLGRVFPASALQGLNVKDARFFPKSVLQWIFYPFFWLQGRSFVVSEEPLRDPRFAFVYMLLTGRLVVALLKKTTKPSRQSLALTIFFVVTYFVWLVGFSILRYALALEAISGIVIFSALSGLFQRRLYLASVGAVTIFALAFTKPLGWGRIGYGKSLIEPPVPVLASNSVVLMAGVPLGFVVPYLDAPSSVFLSLALMRPESKVVAFAQRRVAAGDEVELLTNADSAEFFRDTAILSALGLMVGARDCVAIGSPVQKTIRFCKVTAIH